MHLSHRLRSSCWLEGADGAKRYACREKDFKQTLCADIDGLSLHPAVLCDADDLQALEQLCRYITRPALAKDGCKPTPLHRRCFIARWPCAMEPRN